MDNVIQKLNVFIRHLFNDWPFETNFSMKNYKRTTFYNLNLKKKWQKLNFSKKENIKNEFSTEFFNNGHN